MSRNSIWMVVALLLVLVGISGCGGTSIEQEAAASRGYSIKVVWLKDISSGQQRECAVLQPGPYKSKMTVVIPGVGVEQTVWGLDKPSSERFSEPALGACYRYQERYYYVAP